MADNLDKLYGAVSAKFDIGDAEAFKAKMQTPEDRKKFYDVVSGKGFDLGDYNSYETRLGGTTSVQKKSPIQTGGEKSTVVAEQVTQPSGESGGTVEAAVEVESLPTNYDRLIPKSYSNLKDGTNYFTGSIRNGKPVVKKWDAAAQEFQTQNDPAITELAQQKFGKPNQLTPVEEQKDIARKGLTAKSDTGNEITLPETSAVLEKAGVATYLNKDKIADEAAITYNRTKSIAQQPQVSTYMQMFDLYKNTDDPTVKDDIEKQLEELKSKPFDYNEINSAVEGKDNPSLQPLMPSIPELKTVGDAVSYAMSQMEENKALIDDYANTENDLLKINEEYQKLSPQDPKGFWYNAIRAVNEHTEALDKANKIALNSDQGAMEELENTYIKSKIFPKQPTEGLGTAGELAGGMAAAVAPTVGATMAATSLTGNPIAGMIAGGVYSAQDMARLQYANGFQEMYNEMREKNPNLPPNIAYETAKDYAKQTAGVQGTVGAAVGMFLPALRTESVLAQKASSQIAKQFFVDIAKNSGFDFGVGASSQMLNNYIGKNLGSDRSIFDGALESGGMMAVQGLMVGTLTHGFPAVSKYVTAKDRENAVNFLANSAPEKLETVFGNAVKNGSSPIEIHNLRDEVMNRMAAFSQMPPNLSAEKKIKLAPLYEERNRLATHLKDNPASEMGVMPEIEKIDRQIAEEAGFPLTEKEAKRLEDLNAIAKDKEDRLTATEIKERNHLRKRNTKAEKEAAAVEEESKTELDNLKATRDATENAVTVEMGTTVGKGMLEENIDGGAVESKKADIEKRRQEELVALLPQNKTPIHSLDFSTAFNIGIPEFYQQMFDMAKQGKDTIAGVKEKNATLLKKLYNEGKLRDKKDVWLALNPKAAEINAKYDAELTALGEPAPPAAEEVVAKEDGNVEVVKEEEAVSEGGREAQSDGKYKRLVEPSKPIDKMNSQELYDLAVENKKALKEQDREFAGKTEKEKEDGGYYDSIDDVADLRDASEKISWIESSKDADEVAKNIRSTVAKMDKNNISEYDLAIINAATLKAEEFGINQNDFIGKVVKAEFERHANIEDAKFMAKALREKIGNAKEKPELPVSKEPVAEKKKTIKEAKEEHKVFKEQILAAEPTTPRQFIMQWFAGGGKMKTAEFKKETGFSKGEEFRKRIWAHTNKEYFMRDRKGMRVGDEVKPYSLDDIIALVQEEWATNHGGELDYQDVRNEVIDVLQSHNSPSEMIENLREDFADKEGNIIADKYDRAAMRNEEAQEAMGVFENADKHAEDEKALAAVEKIDELELDEKDISSIEKFVSKFTDVNGETDWAKAAEAVEDVFNEAYGELTKNAAKQIEKIIADGKAKNEPGRKGENLPEDTGNKGDNGGQDKVSESEKIIREEYSQKLADADAKIEAAKQAKQSDVNAINKRANLFGGDTGAEKNKGLFGAQKDDYAQIEKITAEHDKKIAEAEIAKQKLVDEQDKAIKNAVDLEKRQQKLELGKDKLADGLDDLINIIGGGPKFFVAPENKPKVIDALAKIGRGLMDIGEAKIDDVIEKIKAYVLSKSRNITEEDVEELKGEILDKINIETISEEPINAKNIDKAVAKKLKEETREAGRDLIRKRRASIDSENLKTELYAQSLEKQTTKEQREVLPFILEKTNVPEKLGRPDLVETLKNDKAKLEPIAAQIREHFDKMWEKIVANTENLDAEQIKDYVTHIWDIPKDKTEQVANWFSTKNRFLNKRYISTIEEGVDLFGLKPKVLDIAQIIRIHDSVANTVIANGEFLTDLKTMSRDGMPLIIRADKSPEGWVTVDHPAMSSPLVIPGENGKANVVIKLPYKVHPDLAEPVKAIFGKKIDSKFLDNYMKADGVMKKIGLSVSLFHHGALSETAIALMGPLKAVTAIGKLGKAAIVNKFEGTPLAQFPNEAVDAINHGVKFGHTLDINTGAVNGILEKIASKTKDIPVAGKAAELLSSFNEKWDTGLWNYLHDGLKLYAFMDAKTKMPENTANKKQYLQEHAQLINDYFGGQNWDVLLTSPRAQQIMRLALLSPDWTISKLRLAGAPVGLGAMSKDAKYVRAKASGMFWVKAAIYYGVGLNLMNAYFRKQDRKEHPEYYPEGNNSFMDNTMFGNTVGHKTHLFTGRYEDGSEMYRRWGKEFRELPELFMNEDGVSFPKPLLEKAGGKMAPAAQIVSKLMTGNSLGGYEDWDLKDKKGWAWTAGAMKVIAKGYTPMSTGNFFRDDKEWKPADLMFPGGKGMTKSKTIDLFKKGIDQGDEAYVKEIYSGAVRNNLDAYGLFKTAIQSSNAEKTKELMQGIKTVDDVKQKIRDTTDKEEKQKLFRKLRKFEIENKQKHQANKLWKEAEKELRE